ncbi:MAG: ribulose-phosphate 3-epimerase [Acidobacteriota bacterium]|nr:ribulose-phosphate 3-epimerase [Acidobacteriota bacterium]
MAQIVPSILSADFARLAEEIARVEQASISMLHIDIMDGHFVPNLTMGPPVVRSIRKVTKATLDLHCMIENPGQYAPLFIEAGADQISVHQEACRHLDRTLRLIQDHGAKAGVVLNPATPVGTLEDVLDFVDYVLVMSVNPGFEAQKFIPNSFNKVRQLARIREDRRLRFAIEIDGGVSKDNVQEIVRAGCDWLVAGSAVFHSADPAATVKEMQQLAADAASFKV